METPENDIREHSDRGATATEYAILGGFIAVVILAGVTLFGVSLGDYYNHLVTLLRAGLNLP
jgi:pilus assembly protein Flp/PilA